MKILTEILLSRIQAINVDRCSRWHGKEGVNDWNSLEWMGAAAGELGEAANLAKKLKRFDFNMQQNATIRSLEDTEAIDQRAELVRRYGREIAGTMFYLLLAAAREGLDPYEILRDEFNHISEREGFPERLP